ncbi:hypothetical protein GQ43DRAFT_443250 [Delitschia confertaspora ATCC 74209]|uniref:Ceramide glucosyltransferase n=1 Tax=Delitschia confertaspora ATCC 74209 TaxID=1513339 RepID=A0A9P4JG77_9PLEO|nr:hypothetical protein GQ43DRAFT_443250 [Delitschia confertaspora ATCC 74209]
MARDFAALVCLIWYCAVMLVCGVGYLQLSRYYSNKPKPARFLTHLPDDQIPHVTIIRPVKGLEPRLYECLAATFRQTYPKSRLTIYLCVSKRSDPALPILERLIRDFPNFDSKVFIEEEDPLLQREYGRYTSDGVDIDALSQKQHVSNSSDGSDIGSDIDSGGDEPRRSVKLGPNPKIRNMSRAYREAKGDIVWIIDCNVWVGKGVCGRMVDLLCGFGGKRKNKFVHQLPLVVDMDGEGVSEGDRKRLLNGEQELSGDVPSQAPQNWSQTQSKSKTKRIWQRGGGRLEEMFMSSSHAKFYTAINTVLLAPCIVGKSNMFRKSHLDYLTKSNPDRSPGIDFFSDNICEDHLIGDALWKKPQAFEERGSREKDSKRKVEVYGKHALLFGDLCFQPVSHTSIPAYIARRVRWLRVRKFTVTLATLVEPGTESILCSLYGAYAVSTIPFFSEKLGIPNTWAPFAVFWLCSMLFWCAMDWSQYRLLHSAKSLEIDADTPDFVLPPLSSFPTTPTSPPSLPPSRQPLLPLLPPSSLPSSSSSCSGKTSRRSFPQWFPFWLGRELLAFPIWFWAVWGGVTVTWRGRKFWVGVDMKVHEIGITGLEMKTRKEYVSCRAVLEKKEEAAAEREVGMEVTRKGKIKREGKRTDMR